MDLVIEERVKKLIEENQRYIGKEVADKAKQNIEKKTKEKGGSKADEKVKEKTRTTRARKQS
jgi:hypothetical protein